MDTLITYDEALALVANPPTLAPRPNFTNLRALRRHLQRALQRLVNPSRPNIAAPGEAFNTMWYVE